MNIENRMIDYLDGEMTEQEKNAFERHIEACPDCKSELLVQQQWLEHKNMLEENVQMTAEEKERVHENIMNTIKSNEQAQRAVMYINKYQKDQKKQGKNISVAADSSEKEEKKNDPVEKDTGKKAKILNYLFRPQSLAGSAAIIVLLFVAGFLIRDLAYSRSDKAFLLDSFDEIATMEQTNDLEVDSAGLDFGGSIMAEDGIEKSSDDMIMGEEESSEETFQANGGVEGEIKEMEISDSWTVYTGKLSDLAAVSNLFAIRITDNTTDTNNENGESVDADATVSFLSSADALRILVRKSALDTSVDSNASNSEIVSDSDEPRIDASNGSLENGDNIEIMILSAWPSWEINQQMDTIRTMLETSNSAYSLKKITDQESMLSVEIEIGQEQFADWQKQINEQELGHLDWIAIRIGG